MASIPQDFHGAVSHFAARCRQHLHRGLFSYRAAADVLEHSSDAELTERYGTLLADAVGGDLARVDRRDRMLARSHLGLQRHNFALFLNRVAAAKWEYHRSEVLHRWLGAVQVRAQFAAGELPPFGLAELNVPNGDSLTELVEHLRTILQIPMAFSAWAGLDRRIDTEVGSVHLWAQIVVGFAVRYQYEHRNARVDRAFRNAVVSYWPQTSWASVTDVVGLDRMDELGMPVRLPIRHEDLLATSAAMVEAVQGIAAAVAGTGAGSNR